MHSLTQRLAISIPKRSIFTASLSKTHIPYVVLPSIKQPRLFSAEGVRERIARSKTAAKTLISAWILWRHDNRFSISKVEDEAERIFRIFIPACTERNIDVLRMLTTEDFYSKIKNALKSAGDHWGTRFRRNPKSLTVKFDDFWQMTDRPRLVSLAPIRTKEPATLRKAERIITVYQAAIRLQYTSIQKSTDPVTDFVVFEYSPDSSSGSWRIRDRIFESRAYYQNLANNSSNPLTN